jgi:NitT/TauT family transport system substrate-binding protein
LRRALATASVIMSGAGARDAAAADLPYRCAVGILGTDVSLEPLYAQQTGVFARHGVAAGFTALANGGAIVSAVASGALDIGFSNLVSAAGAIGRGIPLMLLAPAAVYTARAPVTVLVQARTSHYQTGADLSGKVIGIDTLQSLTDIGLRAWLQSTGGDPRAARFIELPFSEMGAALAQGRVDAAMITEPAWTSQRAEVALLAPAFNAIANEFLIGAFVTSKRWYDANRDAAGAFVAAIAETARWANGHRAQTAPLLADQLKMDPAVVKTMTRATYGEQLSPALIQPVLDVAARFGTLAPMHAADLLR